MSVRSPAMVDASRPALWTVSLKRCAIALALLWALYVVRRYSRLDGRFLIPYLKGIGRAALLHAAWIGLAGLVSGAALAFLGTRLSRIGSGARAFLASGVALLIVLLLFCAASWTSWRILAEHEDGFLASSVVGIAALAGAGWRLGSRLARGAPPLWLAAAAVASPFAIISVLGGCFGPILALLWLYLLADGAGAEALALLGKIDRGGKALEDRTGFLGPAVGVYILSLAVLVLGLAGLASAASLFVFLAGFTVLFLGRIRERLEQLVRLDWRRPVEISLPGWCGLSILAALFSIYWIAAVAPEVGPDALGFRTAGPAAWLRMGAIAPLPEMLGSYGHVASEMVYLLAMPLAGLPAAKVVQLGLAALLLASACRLAAALCRGPDSPAGMLGFFGSTIVWLQFAWGFVDIFQAFFFYGAILALGEWLEDRRPARLAVSGILGAAATAVKLNGAAALAVAGLVVLWLAARGKRPLRLILRDVLWLGLPAFLGILPWLARSYALTGNPVFPFLNRIFQSPLGRPDPPAAHFGPGLKCPDILSVPYDLFIHPHRYGELGTYNPMLLALAPLALIGLLGRGRHLLWLAAGVLSGLAWLVTEQNTRYSMNAGFLLAVALGLGISRLGESSGPGLRRLLGSLTIFLAVFGFGAHAMRPAGWLWRGIAGPALPTAVVLGSQPEPAYLTANVLTYLSAEQLNRNWGIYAKTWQATGLRDHLYFMSRTVSGPHGIRPLLQPLDEILTDRLLRQDIDAIHRRLVESGYTHLLIFESRRRLLNVPKEKREGVFSLPFERKYLRLECADREVLLFRIRPAAGEEGARWTWSENLLEDGGSRTARLGQGDILTRSADVEEGRLYALDFAARIEGAGPGGLAKIHWLDAAGRILLVCLEPVPAGAAPGPRRILQTAPPGARRAAVYLVGPACYDDVVFREARSEPALPEEAEPAPGPPVQRPGSGKEG